MPGALGQARQRTQALSVDGVDEHILLVVVESAKDCLQVVVRQLVSKLQEPRSEEERGRRDPSHADRLVVDGAEVEAALELGDDRDQRIAVRIAQRCKVAVVALEVGKRLGQERGRARVDDPLDGLCQHRRLHLGGRVRCAVKGHAAGRAAFEVVPLEARDQIALPEDDVRDQPVCLLHREQSAKLVRGALRVEARPGDRVEARVPEPLERVVAHGWNREAEQPIAELGGLGVRLEQGMRALVERAFDAGRRYLLTVGEGRSDI